MRVVERARPYSAEHMWTQGSTVFEVRDVLRVYDTPNLKQRGR